MNFSSHDYLDTLKEAVGSGRDCSMIITGNSMQPFLLHGRDTIYFRAPKERLKRGDMVFFQRENGQYVMHRLLKTDERGYYFIGDNQTEVEGPVSSSQIFAVVYQVKRKGRILGPKSFWWVFFRTFWLRIIPLRPFFIKCFRRLSSGRSRQEG